MEASNPVWDKLINGPLHLPNYLQAPAFELSRLNKDLAKDISQFLRKPAKALEVKTERVAHAEYNPAEDAAFNCHTLTDGNSFQIILSKTAIDLICPMLFGGPLKEVPLRKAAGQGLAVKVAEKIMELIHPDKGTPVLNTPGEDLLSTQPVTLITYSFDVEMNVELEIKVAYTRTFTDAMAQPATTVPEHVISSLKFPALAVAAKQNVPMDQITSWQPGTIVKLPKASTERVVLLTQGNDSETKIGEGELGADAGVRSIRLNTVTPFGLPIDEATAQAKAEAMAAMSTMAPSGIPEFPAMDEPDAPEFAAMDPDITEEAPEVAAMDEPEFAPMDDMDFASPLEDEDPEAMTG